MATILFRLSKSDQMGSAPFLLGAEGRASDAKTAPDGAAQTYLGPFSAQYYRLRKAYAKDHAHAVNIHEMVLVVIEL